MSENMPKVYNIIGFLKSQIFSFQEIEGNKNDKIKRCSSLNLCVYFVLSSGETILIASD